MAKKKKRITYIAFGMTYEDAIRHLEDKVNKKTSKI